MAKDELFPLAQEINKKLSEFQENSIESTALPFFWWYLFNEEGTPYFYYEYAERIIRVFTDDGYLTVMEGAKAEDRTGVYKIESSTAEQLDEFTLRAYLLCLSSLSSALRKYAEESVASDIRSS